MRIGFEYLGIDSKGNEYMVLIKNDGTNRGMGLSHRYSYYMRTPEGFYKTFSMVPTGLKKESIGFNMELAKRRLESHLGIDEPVELLKIDLQKQLFIDWEA